MINKSLLPLVKDDVPYMEAAPELFGADFAKRSKEFLRSNLLRTLTRPIGSPFFERAFPWGGEWAEVGGLNNNYNNYRGVTETDKPALFLV